MAMQFPWIHFYAFDHKSETVEYDPAQPHLTTSAPITVQTELNKTMSGHEFTKEMARTMGDRRGVDGLVMICHAQDSIRQLAFHVLLRPRYSLLDICGVIPVDYLDGELVLPMYIPNNKTFMCMVAHQQARCKVFDQDTYVGEIGAHPTPGPHSRAPTVDTIYSAGFFQGVMRVTQSYDDASKDMIAGEFARSTASHHGCSQEVLKASLLSTLDLLWATHDADGRKELLDLLNSLPSSS
jgi:hypothetical protein